MTRQRILIVDDDDDIRANIKDILDDLGYRTDTAHDGPSALRLVQSSDYDVAILDYQMPGMNGATLHREIVKLRPEMASIMVTAYAEGDGAEKACDSGVRHILRKPVDLGELLRLVKASEKSQNSTVDENPSFGT